MLIYHDFFPFFSKVKPVSQYLQVAAEKLGKQPDMNLIEMGNELLCLHDKIIEETEEVKKLCPDFKIREMWEKRQKM